ncbi:phiSA1p31-related protein [Streptomyces sp. NPDC012950]|uniref:phiSA1p31-related protein n=1 Tax=Streptomyces sp. NPDC012950 TaxID=3364858 RepID=UPI0036A0982F
MTVPEPAIRMIDLNENLLVVALDRTGVMRTSVRGICSQMAADILRGLADDLEADHPAYPCHWDEERDTPAPADRPAEPLPTDGARLDAGRKVWTDGTGHVWDLSVPWQDAVDVRWRWTGRMDGTGTPLMQSVDGVESLDVIRAVVGPIVPVGEGE